MELLLLSMQCTDIKDSAISLRSPLNIDTGGSKEKQLCGIFSIISTGPAMA